MLMERKSGEIKWLDNIEIDYSKLTAPKYSLFGERIRHVAPTALQCSMFCGGKQCKYDNPMKFKDDEMAIPGLYSSWVTDDILATSRPSTEAIKNYNIMDHFKRLGIKSIINLQHPGEHGACGFGLQSSGFTYEPKDFMDNDVFFYNFGWNDYGVRSLHSILDMVKVMDFAVKSGKVAVHCHAGLGRTGVLIACYLVYSQRTTGYEAIHIMRLSRPKAIQTRGQISCVKDFAQYIKPMWAVFPENDRASTLELAMKRQRNLLHGEIARDLKYVPQIVFAILDRLLILAGVEYNIAKCTRITHFSFMKNSIYKTGTSSDATSTKAKQEPDPTVLKMHNSFEDIHWLSNNIAAQLKAKSTPNVSLITTSENKLLLDPIKKKKKKRKKGKKMKNGDSPYHTVYAASENAEDGLKTPTRRSSIGGSSSDDFTSLQNSPDTKNTLADNISVASFSSAALEGLSVGERIFKHLAFRCGDAKVVAQMERHKRNLNCESSAWDCLYEEENIGVLAGLLWSWLFQLDGPLLSEDEIEMLQRKQDDPIEEIYSALSREIWKLCECFLTFLSKLDNDGGVLLHKIIRRLSILLTGDESIPRDHLEMSAEEKAGIICYRFLSKWYLTLS